MVDGSPNTEFRFDLLLELFAALGLGDTERGGLVDTEVVRNVIPESLAFRTSL